MPNWVSNSVRVTGNKEDLKRFAEQAGQPTTQFGEERERHLSFWNFVRPDDSILDQYHGEEPRKASLEEAMRFESNHWYDWNVRNWGCKWDANDVYFEDWDGELAYDFETPWGFPEGAVRAMVAQYPTLNFTFRFLEDQGWGGEGVGFDGDFAILKEWDIPCTHEERMEYVGYCHCEENDELDYMYDDCPKKKELSNA